MNLVDQISLPKESRMEYFRTDQGRIQASFALHAAQLLRQYVDYSRKLPASERFEATQTICVLQALICNHEEHIKKMKKYQRSFFDSPLPDIGASGLKRHHIKKFNFSGPLTYRKALTSIRNALSHPTHAERPPFYPSTGYTTVRDGSGLVTTVRFTDSPFVDCGRLYSTYTNEETLNKKLSSASFREKYPPLRIAQSEPGKWGFFNGDELYIPVFEAEVPIEELIQFTLELANRLAQPSQANWDGHTIVDLLNAA